MENDYSNAPKTIGELRAEKSGSLRDISPRETLIEILRMIDSGDISPKNLYVCFDNNDDVHFRAAGQSAVQCIGVAQIGMMKFMLPD